MPYKYKQFPKCNFDHIKMGWPCPINDRVIPQGQRELESLLHINQDNISQRLVQALDYCHGTEEVVNIRRKVRKMEDYIRNSNPDQWHVLSAGSEGDGFSMNSSDKDMMKILTSVVVTYPDNLLPRHSFDKTILFMNSAGNRPGYVTLEIFQIANGEGMTTMFQKAIISVGYSLFLSSDIYREGYVAWCNTQIPESFVSNGPCVSNENDQGNHSDFAYAFPCVCWPKEASEWIHRTRLHGWPTQAMVHRIVQDGCHIIPVGDKCSTDTLLQWRISFACAEQLLVHSLTHPQFRVYGLLKYFLFQIKELLEHIIGDGEVLCSYFLKTTMFYAVENSPHKLWKEKNTFLCFRFCLAILIAWVKSGYCPNYFIRNNNMFLRKVHGEARLKLLHLLIDLYNLNWVCLSVESVNTQYIAYHIQQQTIHSRLRAECLRDVNLFSQKFYLPSSIYLYMSLKYLEVAHRAVDVFIAYRAVLRVLYHIVVELFKVYNNAKNNKQRYTVLKKCSNMLKLQASGFLLLASLYYLTGNYRKSLCLCSKMMSTFRLFIYRVQYFNNRCYELYEQLYCGKGYTFWHKFKEAVCFSVEFEEENILLCPPHLHPEVKQLHCRVSIPPMPYAAFLSFLCYQELGDLRRRDKELINLRLTNYDPYQGGHSYFENHWIVHTLLGICYQTVGDSRRAIESFRDSLRVRPDGNPAKERLEALQRSQ